MGQTVLIIDDDRDINEMLGQLMQMAGWEYLRAETGREGMRLAQNRHPDVVVLDMMLPDVDGYEVCRTLTAHRICNDIPVIMLSCMCGKSDELEGVLCGAFRYLGKPFTPEAVLASVRDALAARTAQQPQATGHFEIETGNMPAASAALGRMIRDIAALSTVDDADLQTLREAFAHLLRWFVAQEGAATPVRQRLTVDYQIQWPPPGQAGSTGGESGIFWTLRQSVPELLAAAHVAAPPKPRGGILRLGRKPRGDTPPPSEAQRHWTTFVANAGLEVTAVTDAGATVRLVKRFRPRHLMVPADGTVMSVGEHRISPEIRQGR